MSFNFKHELLFKEIELISGNIKNLDDIIYKTKNFAFLFWGGSLFLITKLENFGDAKIGLLIFLTVIIPIMFWTMDYRWRKHLRFASERERIISRFINSPEFNDWIKEENSEKEFPLYDPVGWIYTTDMQDQHNFDKKYLINRKKSRP